MTTVLLLVFPAAALAAPGDLDPAFGGGQVLMTPADVNGGASSVALQRDDKIVAGGMAQIGSANHFAAVRYLPDGQVDESYGDGGVASVEVGTASSANRIILDDKGRAILTGSAQFGGRLRFAVVRLNQDGTPDSHFGNGGVMTHEIAISSMAMSTEIDARGGLVVGGVARVREAPTKLERMAFAAMRLNDDGSVDETFGEAGVTIVDGVGSGFMLLMQPDGRSLLVGETFVDGHEQFLAARLTTDGKPDPSYGRNGIVIVPAALDSIATAGVLHPDGSLVLVGRGWDGRKISLASAKLLSDGSLDPAYGIDGIAHVYPGSHGVNDAKLDGSGRIVIATTGGVGAVRLNRDGSLDSSFGLGGVAAYSHGDHSAANGIAVDPRGFLTVTGAVDLAGTYRFAVARLYGHTPAELTSPSEEVDGTESAPPSAPQETSKPDPLPVDPLPVDPLPVDPLPVDPLPVDPLPVEPLPVDPLPVDPEPAAPPTPEPAPEEDSAEPETGEPRQCSLRVRSVRQVAPERNTSATRSVTIRIGIRASGCRARQVQIARHGRRASATWRRWTGGQTMMKVALRARPGMIQVRVRDQAGHTSTWKTARL